MPGLAVKNGKLIDIDNALDADIFLNSIAYSHSGVNYITAVN